MINRQRLILKSNWGGTFDGLKPSHITGAYQFWWPEERQVERFHVLNTIIEELKKELENGRSITK